MSQLVTELDGFTAEIDQLLYTPELEAPAEAPHGFAYFITIKNESDRTLKVLYRKWIVRSEVTGDTEILEGDGVVGQQPVLATGEDFTYNSRHFIRHDSVAYGSYFAEDAQGVVYACRLPEMALVIPPWARDY